METYKPSVFFSKPIVATKDFSLLTVSYSL